MWAVFYEIVSISKDFSIFFLLSSSGNGEYTESLHSSGIISVLFTSLSDFEGYVQASAVEALGEAVTTSDVCSNVQVKHVLVGTVNHAPLQLTTNKKTLPFFFRKRL